MPTGRPELKPNGLTPDEFALCLRLRDAWAPRKRVGFFSEKTQALSDACKETLARLGTHAGLTVTFVVEPVPHGKVYIQQHFIRAIRKRPAP